jgi:hypothetical protein
MQVLSEVIALEGSLEAAYPKSATARQKSFKSFISHKLNGTSKASHSHFRQQIIDIKTFRRKICPS